ncbi:hypothetical protein PUNSTDRAFT_53704 [Punctularia strigosozonata HHB-11173 SS5]|uniref:uncharacterized protein n=1 Tax=Punctularia strigosozonata (strain HHB-11173) TaxID=741275 RepID=UPI00044176D2|nr:uncharacterized protein PUNSTDRAFT_53704 [Punctularia strigosozonata HHB-11173 SS5]EIN07371.1 hypothetical protein PUNSTDRAFT_53704 [Punctularia strigosozonata HHB-11173 SS5]
MTKALLLRGRDTNNTSDITMVIQELTPMIEILSSMHHGPETFRILALGHQIRFRQTRDPDEAIRALEVMHAMLALAPPGRRYRHQCLISSAELYLEHGTSYRDLALALTRLQDALSDNHRDVRSRIQGTYRSSSSTYTTLSSACCLVWPSLDFICEPGSRPYVSVKPWLLRVHPTHSTCPFRRNPSPLAI